MRKKLLLGNWKMNKNCAEAREFAEATIGISKFAKENGILVGVAPTYLALKTVKDHNSELIVSAQNVHFAESGAYTGEISISMLQEIGIDTVIIGHSERRQYDNETNQKCNQKILRLVQNKMTAVYCVGETEKEFDQNLTKAVVEKQLKEGLKDLKPEDLQYLVVAYEPVWSIGTGKNASKEIAQDVCAFIRNVVRELFEEKAEELLILYGGSVKPENVYQYLNQEDIDGALVGGASLKVESFTEMINNLVK